MEGNFELETTLSDLAIWGTSLNVPLFAGADSSGHAP